MEEREKRKEIKEESGGLEIDWSSAPTEKTLLANDIDPKELEGNQEEEGSENETKAEGEAGADGSANSTNKSA